MSIEIKKLYEEQLKDVEYKLDLLLNMGGNDETLVDERRRLQKLLREL